MTKTQINTKKRIIQLLQKNGEMRYTDIKSKIGITDTAISKNLAFLSDEGSIEFERRGREKYYVISSNISKIFERKMNMFTNSYLDHLVEDLSSEKHDYEKLYSSVDKKMTSYFSYVFLKSIQTGKNWFTSFDLDVVLYMLVTSFMSKIDADISDDMVDSLDELDWDLYFKSAKKSCSSTINQKNISKMYDVLKKMYPNEFKELEQLSKY